MTAPRILSARELALRAQHEAETLPPTTLRTHVPRHADEIGVLPTRVSTFRPPLPSLGSLVRDGGHPTRPAGRDASHDGARHRPGLSAPEGVVQFSPRSSPRDVAEMRRIGRELLHVRPGSAVSTERSTAPLATSVTVRPSQDDVRRDLAEFRGAMADFTRARYFGAEGRADAASQALGRAQRAYDRLYANMPLTPAMSSILDNLQGQIDQAWNHLEPMMATAHTTRRHRR